MMGDENAGTTLDLRSKICPSHRLTSETSSIYFCGVEIGSLLLRSRCSLTRTGEDLRIEMHLARSKCTRLKLECLGS